MMEMDRGRESRSHARDGSSQLWTNNGMTTNLEPQDLHLHRLHLIRLLLLSLCPRLRLSLSGEDGVEGAIDGRGHRHVEVPERGHVWSGGLGHHLARLTDAACAEASEQRSAVVGRHLSQRWGCMRGLR